MITLLLALYGQEPDISPVHRCAFEDRSRMVLVQMSPTRWMAFNPKTCAIQKIWDGEVDWRGKVFDFSQDNSRAKGKVLFELPSTIWHQEPTWMGVGTQSSANVMSFVDDKASASTPLLDMGEYENIFVAFDESSRAAPFRVEVVEFNRSVGDWFDSTKHGHSDTDWQWNFKQVWPRSGKAQIRWTSDKGASKKKLRNARIFGDYQMFTSKEPMEVVWKGYLLLTKRIILNFELRRGEKIVVASIMAEPDGYRYNFMGDLKGISLRFPPNLGLEVGEAPPIGEYPLSNKMFLRLTGGPR